MSKHVLTQIVNFKPDHALSVYLALHTADQIRDPAALGEALAKAYTDAPHADFVALAQHLADHDRWTKPFTEAVGRRMRQTHDDAEFAALVTLAQSAGVWVPYRVPPELWFRGIEQLVFSEHPAMQRRAVTFMLDAIDWRREVSLDRNNVSPWEGSQSFSTLDILSRETNSHWIASQTENALLSSAAVLIESESEAVRRAGRFIALSMEESIANTELLHADVVLPDKPLADDVDPVLLRLFEIESARERKLVVNLQGDDTALASVLIFDASARSIAPRLDRISSVEFPWLQALGTSLVARDSRPAALLAKVAPRLASVDPVVRQQAALAMIWLQHNHVPFDLADESLPERWRWRVPDPEGEPPYGSDPDPTVEMLRRVWTHTNPEVYAAALEREGLSTPMLLTALLAKKHRVGWDYVLGPFGLPEEAVIKLLDYHRFAWVLDALMPKGAPRFPLWAARERQHQAVESIRAWYAQNRHWFTIE
ncbi:MAG: hypothetical protein AAGF84_12185 [Planctomycetota bacterium]